MNRGIDHLVLCVTDLEAARGFYGMLGFNLTPTAHHPFGTSNFLAQLQGNFLEILTVTDPTLIEPPLEGHFSFAHHNQGYLSEGQGMSMLVFESQDARADQAEFRIKRLDTYEPFDFSRKAVLPTGEEVTVGFSLAFATHPDMPRAAFFCCQQHAPQHFWKPEYQTHDNGARSVLSVILVAHEPQNYTGFFQSLQGTKAVADTAEGLQVTTSRGHLDVMTPAAYDQRFGPETAPDLAQGPRFAAMCVGVQDLAQITGICQKNGVPFVTAPRSVRVCAKDAFGTLIEFSEGDSR